MTSTEGEISSDVLMDPSAGLVAPLDIGGATEKPKLSKDQKLQKSISHEVDHILLRGSGFDQIQKPVFLKIAKEWRERATKSKSIKEEFV